MMAMLFIVFIVFALKSDVHKPFKIIVRLGLIQNGGGKIGR